MKLRAVVGGLAVVATCLAPHASAKAGAGTFHEVSGTFSFTTAAASFTVDVVARVIDTGVSAQATQVAVTITRCAGQRCDAPVTLASAAPAGDVTVAPDLTSGRLNVQLFGRPLQLTWDEVQAGPLPASHADAAHRSYVEAYRVVSAHGAVAGQPCQTDEGAVSVGASADPADAPLPAALPSKAPTRLRSLVTATCAYAHDRHLSRDPHRFGCST